MTVLTKANAKPGDDLDRLLRAFYQAELPDPWPSLEAPVSPPVVLAPRLAPVGSGLWGSRFALAASVAVLITGTILLSGTVRPDAEKPLAFPGVPGEAGATRGTRSGPTVPRGKVEIFVNDNEAFIKGFADPNDLPRKK